MRSDTARLRCQRGLHRTNRFGGGIEVALLLLGERYLENTLEAAAPQLARNTTEHISQTVFTLEPCRARQHPLLIEYDRLYHLYRRGARRIVCRAGLQMPYDL